ncbi:putative non-structural polyprotein [Solenopsis invicta virus 13]|nr:putative non-structural polyprotein [Solenopsis invicta virus 13]
MESYKEACKRQNNKSRYSKFTLEERKMQIRINEANKKMDQEMRKGIQANRVQNKKKMQRIIADMQMMSLASYAIPAAIGTYGAHRISKYGSGLIDSAKNTQEKIDNAADKIGELADSTTGLIATIQSYIKSFTDTVAKKTNQDFDMFIMVADIITALVQLSWTRPENMIKSFLMSAAAIFIRYNLRKLWQFVYGYIIKYAQGISMQNNDDETPSARTIISYIIEYFGYILAAIVGTTVVSNGIMSKKTFDVFKGVGAISMTIKTVKDLDVAFPKIFDKITNWLYSTFGIVPYDELSEIIDGYDKWSKEVRETMQRDPETDETAADKIVYDREFVVKIESLFKQSVELAKQINEKRIPQKIQRQFQILQKFIEGKFKQTDMSGAFGGKPRTEPVIIWLYGEAGQGKSYLSNPFAMIIAQTLNSHIPDDRIFAEIYNRNVEQEYWDGYAGQTVIIYDDFGQKVDSGSEANPEFMEVIRAGNIAPFPLHMAALEDKRRARFQSKAIILSSNIEKPQINSLTYPDAFFRRITVQLKVTCKPEFCYEAKEGVFRADINKINEAKRELGMHHDDLFTDCYEFLQTNPETGDPIATLNFDEVVEMIKARSLEKFNNTRQYVESCTRFLNKYKTKMQSADSDDEFEDAKEEIEEPIYDDKTYYEVITNGKTYIELGRSINDKIVSGVSYAGSLIKQHVSPKAKVAYRAMDKISEEFKVYSKQVIDFIRENDGIKYVQILGAIVAGLGAYGVWRMLVPSHDRIQQIPDGLGATNFGTIKDFTSKVINGNDKFVIPEKKFKKYKNEMMEVCQKTDTYVKICVVPEAAQSGDKFTKNRPAIKVEAISSGDNLTRKTMPRRVEATKIAQSVVVEESKLMTLEAISSGDNLTKAKSAIKVEAISSGDNLTKTKVAPKIEIQEHIEANMQMWKDEMAQTLITNRIWSNLYRISGVVKNTKDTIKPLLNGLFVRSRLMLVPGHLLDFLNKYEKLYIENVTGESYTIPLSDIHAIKITDRFGEDKEAALLVFPKTVKAHGDIVKHFSNGESMSLYRKADVALPLVRYGKSVGDMFAVILGNTTCEAYDKPVILDDPEKGEYVLRTGLKYKLNTVAGDCGAPLIINETQVLRKIAGIHVAGSKDGSAFSESITQKDLERAFVHVGPSDKIIFDPDLTPNLTKFQADLQMGAFYSRKEIVEAFGLPAENFSFVGNCSNAVFVSGKTTLRPSIIHDKVTQHTTKPCVLYHPEVDMYKKNLQKCATKTPYIEGPLLDAAVNDVKRVLFANTDRRLARILTDEEAIQGSPDSEYIGPICRTTSPGYPWVLEKKANTKGKQGWLGADEYTYTPELKAAVDRRIELAQKGMRVPVVWTDTLKDERRPIEKVDSLKTRVFAHGPVDFTIAFRKYFLGFIAHIMENRIDNEQSIGTNVYSRDWARTAKKLLEKGGKVIAGDFSTFDGTLNAGILAKFAEVVNEWYDDGPENALVRYCFMLEIFNSVHLVGNLFYQMNHSQPSGNPATTILNSFYNSVSMRMVFALCAKAAGKPFSMAEYNKYCVMVSYGDDNVLGISDAIIEWFNQQSITDAYAVIGMIYTDEAKTGEAAPPFRKINEVGYLKRNFIKRGNRWYAPLDLGTILEMCNWMRGDIDAESATATNCECAIMELSQHTKQVWDEWEPKIKRAFFMETGNMLNTMTYQEYEEKRLYDYFM